MLENQIWRNLVIWVGNETKWSNTRGTPVDPQVKIPFTEYSILPNLENFEDNSGFWTNVEVNSVQSVRSYYTWTFAGYVRPSFVYLMPSVLSSYNYTTETKTIDGSDVDFDVYTFWIEDNNTNKSITFSEKLDDDNIKQQKYLGMVDEMTITHNQNEAIWFSWTFIAKWGEWKSFDWTSVSSITQDYPYYGRYTTVELTGDGQLSYINDLQLTLTKNASIEDTNFGLWEYQPTDINNKQIRPELSFSRKFLQDNSTSDDSKFKEKYENWEIVEFVFNTPIYKKEVNWNEIGYMKTTVKWQISNWENNFNLDWFPTEDITVLVVSSESNPLETEMWFDQTEFGFGDILE